MAVDPIEMNYSIAKDVNSYAFIMARSKDKSCT